MFPRMTKQRCRIQDDNIVDIKERQSTCIKHTAELSHKEKEIINSVNACNKSN